MKLILGPYQPIFPLETSKNALYYSKQNVPEGAEGEVTSYTGADTDILIVLTNMCHLCNVLISNAMVSPVICYLLPLNSPLSRVICPTKFKIGGHSNPFRGSSITYVGSVCHQSRVIWRCGAHSALTS